MGLTQSFDAPPPPTPPQMNPYAAGPYGGGPPQQFTIMTPEQMQAAFMAGMPPHAFMSGAYGMLPPWQAAAPPTRVEHAVTVRNDVNLKKSSMKMLASTTNSNRLYLEFGFDSALPCAATVYFVVQSNEPVPAGASLTGRLTPHRFRHSGKRTLFPKGSGQIYSQAVAKEEWLDTSVYSLAELTNVPLQGGGRGSPSSSLLSPSLPSSAFDSAPAAAHEALPPYLYPIIVVLETVPETDPAYRMAVSAPATGVVVPISPHTDPVAAAPGGSTSHVGVQLTYATLAHKPGEDAKHATSTIAGLDARVSYDWQLKALRQCVQVAGNVFELREIYGMEGGARASADPAVAAPGERVDADAGTQAAEEILASGSECVVCLTEKRDTTVLPCRHMCMCYDCAQQLRVSTNRCPICRTVVQSLLKFKIDGLASSPTKT